MLSNVVLVSSMQQHESALSIHIFWRRKWQPTSVFLPGKSHGWRSVVGYSPWGRKESDMTERPHFHFHTYISSLLSRPPTPLFPPLLGVTEHTVGKMLFFLLQLLQPAWPFPLSYSICRPPCSSPPTLLSTYPSRVSLGCPFIWEAVPDYS